jgi:predicted lipid-binding transport protein (Tim44 family)
LFLSAIGIGRTQLDKAKKLVTFEMVEIVLLAMVAAFLGMRLYSVLGKRTGHEQEPLPRKVTEERQPAVIRQPVPHSEMPAASSPVDSELVEIAATSGLRAIANADRQFDTELFLEGAKSAYGIILEAYWKGDKATLRFLCDDDVYDSFAEEIDARNARGEVLENRLIRIENARIINASYDHPVGRVTVRFDADIAALVKDANGTVIGGSMTDAVETHDIWTYFRDVKSGDRNWKLDETDSV